MRGFLFSLIAMILIGCTPQPAPAASPGVTAVAAVTATKTASPEQQTEAARDTHIAFSRTREAQARMQQTRIALTPTATITPTKTLSPSATYSIAIQPMVQTDEAFRDAYDCVDPYMDFSPTGKWLVGTCFETTNGVTSGVMLVVQNNASQIVWKQTYPFRTLPWMAEEAVLFTYLQFVHWSSDERYFYFAEKNVGEGPGLFFDDGKALHRLDLKTGEVSDVLSGSPELMVSYSFEFSPSGRWLAYLSRPNPHSLHLLDLVTGEEMLINLEGQWADAGEFSWSPDGMWLVFETLSNFDWDSPRSVNILSMETLQTKSVFQSMEYAPAKHWEDGRLILRWEERETDSSKTTEHIVRIDPLSGETESTETTKP
ncbi:MAG TPA: hypothetical protein VFF68_00265 [Anaerolineaceae bacterium]|nr:hypothetical protein [Anaerolineaceae bacterium]